MNQDEFRGDTFTIRKMYELIKNTCLGINPLLLEPKTGLPHR